VIDKARSGEPGGTFPRAVAWVSDAKAYVASQRDREIVVLTSAPAACASPAGSGLGARPWPCSPAGPAAFMPHWTTATPWPSSTPAADRIVEEIATAAPPGLADETLGGAGSNALALSPDGRTLLVTNGGEKRPGRAWRLGPGRPGAGSAGRKARWRRRR